MRTVCSLNWVAVIVLMILLEGCQTTSEQTIYKSSQSIVVQNQVNPALSGYEAQLARQRILADILFAAANAFDDNRLMSPAGDNAMEYYQQVLELDSSNSVAQEGVLDIVRRYIALAEQDINTGNFSGARNFLARAKQIGELSGEIEKTILELHQAERNQITSFKLDKRSVAEESLAVMVQLANIAAQIQQQEATFLIKAPTDTQGRWMYKVMRESLGGYRLRGNIEIDEEPSVTLMSTNYGLSQTE